MRVLAALSIIGLLAASCGDDDGDTTSTADPPTTSVASTTAAEPTTTTGAPSDPATLPIVLCEDVDELAPSVIGTLPWGSNGPWELRGVLMTYAAEHPDTYAGQWIARDYGGTVVLAFTDDPAPHLEEILQRRPMETDLAPIEPRPPITVDWTVADSGYAVDVVQVAYTEAELAAIQDAVSPLFDRDDLPVFASGRQTTLNRVSISMTRPTVEHLALIAEALDGDFHDAVCVEGPLWDDSIRLPTVDDPFTPMADAGADPLVLCAGSGPVALSALEGDPDVPADSDDPLHVVLHRDGMHGQPPPTEGWRTLNRDDDRASFYWTDGASFVIHDFENTPAGWALRGSGAASGDCPVRIAIPDGLATMEIRLDPENPPDPASTTLHLLVNQRSCSGGASGVENMLEPEVIETADEIRLAIGVIPPEGPQTCPGNEPASITIELDLPIGERDILDGLAVPAEALTSDR